MAEPRYKIVNGEYIELTADELAEMERVAAEHDLDFTRVRQERNAFLNSSDWTQLVDSSLTDEKKAEWATYRQELRDLPATSNEGNGGKVSEVVWPTPPE
jgi:hypothetical protein|tara:strand:+ start:309 stop:608 length:300 start_codon:yes stop_codon:yes gene_type:complete